MPDVCLYFQVHQPYRLRRYGLFDVGRRSDYFDDAANEAILRKVAARCYLPASALLRDLVERHDGRFRLALSITGTALEQLARWCPEALEAFRALAATGCVEVLAETSHHSLVALEDAAELDAQVAAHAARVAAELGAAPRVFRNTELIASDAIAAHVAARGYAGLLTEGPERALGWRSPHFAYASAAAPGLGLLLRSRRLSDDVAFRFADPAWPERPLTAEKLAGWVHAVRGDVVGLFMDYETLGEHQPAESGIFELVRRLPAAILAAAEGGFVTPSEALGRLPRAGTVALPEAVSWADEARDLSAWLGNAMQRSAQRGLYELLGPVRAAGDAALLEDWRRLSTSDHVYYMCTKRFADGDVHRYFSPHGSPYEAYIGFTNALCDVALRAGVRGWRPPEG